MSPNGAFDDDFDDDDFDDELDELVELGNESGAVERTLTVSEFVKAVNRVLTREFSPGVWVQGEVVKWHVVGRNAYCQLVENKNGKTVGAAPKRGTE